MRLSAIAQHKPDQQTAVVRGAWSAATISLFNTWTAFDQNSGPRMSFDSPDGQKRISVDGANVTLHINGITFSPNISNFVTHDAELGWSPDSTKYFLTWSESGELGPWHMQVYSVDDSGVHKIPNVATPARKDFEQRIRSQQIDKRLDNPMGIVIWDSDQYCEPYHEIGGRWLNGSKEILMSVLVPNVGDCRYGSDFNVYRVDATTGRILERLEPRNAIRRYGQKYLPRISP